MRFAPLERSTDIGTRWPRKRKIPSMTPLPRPGRTSPEDLPGAVPGRIPDAHPTAPVHPGIVLLVVASLLIATPCATAGALTDEEAFPTTVEILVEGTPQVLHLTGTTVRRKFFFSIYRMGHYMEAPPTGTPKEVRAAILEDGPAKRVVMRFVRDVPQEKILSSLRRGLRDNTTRREFVEIARDVERFGTSISRSAREGDHFELQWLPGAAVTAYFEGDPVFEAESLVFARALWSIWFGERSVVDPVDLRSRLLEED